MTMAGCVNDRPRPGHTMNGDVIMKIDINAIAAKVCQFVNFINKRSD